MRFHGVRRFLLIAVVACAAALSVPLQAQYEQTPGSSNNYAEAREWDDEVPAHIAFVEGTVTLEREGRLEPAEANLALLAGDRLRTRQGRIEVLFADGSALYVDENTELDLLSGSLVRLMAGRLRVSITKTTAALDYRIDAPAASVWIQAAGEYRVDVRTARRGGSEVDLSVIRGSAELVNEHGRTLVRAGTHAVATADLAPSLPYVANSADWDDFDEWTDRQRGVRVGTHSTRYLPTELRYYGGAFDHNGTWDYLPSHGYVWYPRVSTSWRPYSQGRWSFTGHFGWFWVGIDRWSWPTHHYGRWGVHSGSWYWIPDRRWSPAWVSWGQAPGYVSWCPLGFDGRPVYGFRYSDPWSAWTIMPSRYFVPNVWVTQHVVVHTTIAPVVRTQFVERQVAPIIPARATARSAPIHAPTSTRAAAVPRNAGPAYSGQEAWRSRTSNSAVPRGTTAIGSAGSRDGSRSVGQPDTDVQRAVPERSRLNRPANTRTDTGGVEAPRASAPNPPGAADDETRRAAPRRTPSGRSDDDPPTSLGSPNGRTPRPSDPSPSTPTGPARTRPEIYSPPQSRPSAPVQRAEPDREPSRVPERAAPRESTPSYRAEPPRQSAPPPRTEPDRGPSRVPERAAPRESAPPPSAQPAPSRGRGGSDSPPPAPPSRGGGSGDGKATPRSRGGGD